MGFFPENWEYLTKSPPVLQQGTDFEYRQVKRVSNSFMSRIGSLIKHGEVKGLGFVQGLVFAFGDAIHKAILEPQNFKQEEYKDFSLDWEVFDKIIKSCNENQRLQDYLAYSFKEVTHFFEMENLPCKGKIDLVHLGASLIVDLKTTSKTTYEEFAKTVKSYQYDRQMAFYCDACGAKKAVIVGISKVNYELFFYEMTDEDFEKGRAKYTKCLKQIIENDLLKFAS